MKLMILHDVESILARRNPGDFIPCLATVHHLVVFIMECSDEEV